MTDNDARIARIRVKAEGMGYQWKTFEQAVNFLVISINNGGLPEVNTDCYDCPFYFEYSGQDGRELKFSLPDTSDRPGPDCPGPAPPGYQWRLCLLPKGVDDE